MHMSCSGMKAHHMFSWTNCFVATALICVCSGAARGQSWTGTNSTQWNLTSNWSGGALPSGGTAEARVEGYGDVPPGAGFPVIDSSMNTYWGVSRFRGPGLHLTQTGGTHEWPNGSGRSSIGFAIFSRPPGYPSGPNGLNDKDHPCLVTLTGGTMITDQLGLGTPGGLNSGCFYSDPPNGGGDYTVDTVNYRNWQNALGDNRYGWGRLEITGDATLIIRPNRFVYPTGYVETTPYWAFAGGTATDSRSYRLYDVGISTDSQLLISGNGTLIAPLKIFHNANAALADRDVLAQLLYYAGLVQAGTPPHYVYNINGVPGYTRLIAGPGESLQFRKYPGVVNGSLWGGYFTVTATTGTPTWLTAVPEPDQAVVALEGIMTPPPTAEPYFVVNADPNSSHLMNIAEADANGDALDYDWLSLSASSLDVPPGGNLSCAVTIDHVTPALAAGVYTAYVKFTDASSGEAVLRRIQLTVIGCQWSIAPASRDLDRYHIRGSGDPVGNVELTVENTGKPNLTYAVAKVPDEAGTAWLSLNGKTGGGPLAYQATDTVTATVDPTGLGVGDYACTIRFTNNCAPADMVDYTVTLHVRPSNYTAWAPGLVAYYGFEDNLRDWTGNGYDGVVAGGSPTYVEGDEGRAIHFDGPASGDDLNLGPVPCPSGTGASKAMSMAMWYRSESMPEDTWLIAKSQSPGGVWKGWHIKLASAGGQPALYFIWCHDGLRETLAAGRPTGLFDGNWHLIALTIEDVAGGRVNVRGYYDGQLLGEALDRPFEPAPAALDVHLSVGAQASTLGDVDNLSFWQQALRPDQVLSLFENGFAPMRPWPDADGDGDVDQIDFSFYQLCYSGGNGGLAAPACSRFDWDWDNDVDESDFDKFRDCGTGPAVPLDLEQPPLGCNLF